MPRPTPYPDLNAVLDEMLVGIREILGHHFVGAYLQGSFAVGDFDRNSDVDFVVVTERELSGNQVVALQLLHDRVYGLECGWAQHLEGSYFPRDILRRRDHCGSPLWFLDHGSRSLILSNHCNTLVVRSVVSEKGVTLAGPDPRTLVDPVEVEDLRREIRDVMSEWWSEIETDIQKINNRFYQGYVVLNYCRMLHDLLTGFVGSKRAGAEWVNATLDPRWKGLIDRAWSSRSDPAVSVRTPTDPNELNLTIEFVRYILGVAGEYSGLSS